MVFTDQLPRVDKIFTGFDICAVSGHDDDALDVLKRQSIGVAEGKIKWLVADGKVPFGRLGQTQIIRGEGRLLTPGLIDCHTHVVYGGNRSGEWALRMAGKSYEEIARQGGGILATVQSTRSASEQDLFGEAASRVREMIRLGVTTIEIKSGYGLDLDNELKMLRVANRIGSELSIDVEATLLAAHAVPPEFRSDAGRYVDLICDSIIPKSIGHCTAVDAFCESIAFDCDRVRRVFESAKAAGLQIKIHAEQLSHTGAAVMAAEMGALSVDHLEFLAEADVDRLAELDSVATLLPGAFYCLRETKTPPVKSLIDRGVPIAVATDCNPGSSPMVSVLLAANMACTLFDLPPALAFAGITRNAARALGRQDSIGSIESGKQADFAIWEVDDPVELLYRLGGVEPVEVYRSGERIR